MANMTAPWIKNPTSKQVSLWTMGFLVVTFFYIYYITDLFTTKISFVKSPPLTFIYLFLFTITIRIYFNYFKKKFKHKE
jgi:hypothetical protein